MDEFETQLDMPLSVDEVSKYTGYSKSYIYKLIHEKRIPYYKPGRSRTARVFFKKKDLDSFIFRERSSADYELIDQADLIINTQISKRKSP